MTSFATKRCPAAPDAIAPDGSEVRMLLALSRGSLAHFRLAAGQTSIAVAHRTVEEIWYVVAGRGEMWRELGDRKEVVAIERGVSITIPAGTRFQFRVLGSEALEAVGVTMPPWPGTGEACEVDGIWPPTIRR